LSPEKGEQGGEGSVSSNSDENKCWKWGMGMKYLFNQLISTMSTDKLCVVDIKIRPTVGYCAVFETVSVSHLET
jgi:hypothetical protein